VLHGWARPERRLPGTLALRPRPLSAPPRGPSRPGLAPPTHALHGVDLHGHRGDVLVRQLGLDHDLDGHLTVGGDVAAHNHLARRSLPEPAGIITEGERVLLGAPAGRVHMPVAVAQRAGLDNVVTRRLTPLRLGAV